MTFPRLFRRIDDDEYFERAACGTLKGLYFIDNDLYHRGPGVSSTGIKTILQSPGHYLLPPKEPTDAMKFGTAVHAALLEPDLFEERYCYYEDGRRQGKAWEAFRDAQQAAGREIISKKDWLTICEIVPRLDEYRTWRNLMRDAEVELAAFHRDPETGLLMKAKADIWNSDLNIIGDVKTCGDASEYGFGWQIADLGYHISAPYYLDVFSAALGRKVDTFLMIAVEKTAPYVVKFYPASEQMLEIGRAEYRRGLKILKKAMDEDEWPVSADEISTIELPAAFTRRMSDDQQSAAY